VHEKYNMHELWDYIIVGQGIAGTTLAWQLHWRNARVLLIDRDEETSSSKIAAGLITPITGQRFVKSWRFDELWSSAQQFYRRVEELTGCEFFALNSQVRLFSNAKEQGRFAKRQFSEEDAKLPTPLVNEESFDDSFGGFEMQAVGQLNVLEYLTASRSFFEQRSAWIEGEVGLENDIAIRHGIVELVSHKIKARCLIFCQGYSSDPHPWFPQVEFDATRGEIITVRVPGLTETRIINRGVWLAPLGGELFRAGSTYDWDDLTSGPTEAGKANIVERLQSFLRLPFQVVNHQAAVRPIVIGRHPIVGLSAADPQIGIFNGLGSKGSLQAPSVAGQFAQLLTNDKADEGATLIDAEIRVDSRFPFLESKQPKASKPKLTELAHEFVGNALKAGELAIDATAGNGHDTLFLALQVGHGGQVIAIDIQAQALQRTQQRVQNSEFENVTTVERCHSQMANIVDHQDHGRVGAVMFNLGYLPKGDKSVITRAHTSLIAIKAALKIIRPGGVVSILAYPGHSGGDAETEAVTQFIDSLSVDKFAVSKTQATDDPSSPILIRITAAT
jgi:glycine oxidase